MLALNFKAERPLQKLTTDVSYVYHKQGRMFLSVIKDCYDNSILVYTLSDFNDNKLVFDTIDLVFHDSWDSTKVCVLHSDQGFQYTNQQYLRKLEQYGVTILENNRQATIKNYFYKYPSVVRETVKIVTVDMSGSYIPIIKQLFPRAKIVLDRFHIIQHLSRAMMSTRIDIMKTFYTPSLPYRAMKNHWRILQKDSRKLSQNLFYSRTFGQTLTPKEVVQKTLEFSDQLRFYYNLYQILLFHFQKKNSKYFFKLLEDNLNLVNPTFKTVFKTFLKYKTYITNAIELPYSNAKLEATNKFIKDIKRQAFGFRNFKNFKTKMYIALNSEKGWG
ncbi:TPA: ISL3 family transposase [Streptococcus suis]|nr:ISL3 family transposase [Streptococcus suis]